MGGSGNQANIDKAKWDIKQCIERVRGAIRMKVHPKDQGFLLDAVDRFQQRHAVLAFPLAVWRKFGDDQAGNLAALIAYYAFVSVFPLLLVLVTVLGFVLAGDHKLQQDVLNSALTEFPVIGPQLRDNIHSLGTGGGELSIGLIGTFLGARGVASTVQNAMNQVWAVVIETIPSSVGRTGVERMASLSPQPINR